MKKIITTTKYIYLGLLCVLGFAFAENTQAAWVYTNHSIPYTVSAAANLPPIVDAGPDKALTQPQDSVSVTGTATDPDGTIAGTQWTKVSGPATYVIGNPSSLTSLMGSLTTLGTYTFRLTATDNLGLSASDDMQIVVTAAPPGSTLPDLISSLTTPVSMLVNNPVTLQATITNQGTATTGAGFSNFFQVASSSNGAGTVTDLPSVALGTLAPGASSTVSRSYTFPSTGIRSVRVCADKTASSSTGSISESNENNNCSSAWTNVTVTPNTVNGSCGATHYSCNAGTSTNNNQGSTEWTWMCTGSNGGGNASCSETIPATFQCSDGIDNDGDKLIDHKDEPTADPAKKGDPGCLSGQDNDEKNSKPIYQEN
jgi:hypothetical protein